MPAPPPLHRLSKSRYMAGLSCTRRLWLLVHRPDEKREPTVAERRRMAFGIEFGRDVARLFEGGVLVDADARHPREALEQTAELMAGSAPALFEAAFLHQDVLIRADVLTRSTRRPGAWSLIEVKSASNGGSNRKGKLAEYVPDMAVQLHVLEGAGVEIDRVSLAWVDSAYERVGDLDWSALVAIEDFTEAVRTRAARVGAEVDGFLALLERVDMPDADYGKTKCAACEFGPLCWGDEPADSIIHLPRLSDRRRAALEDLGVRRIPEIPEDFELSKGQAPMVEAFRHPQGLVARPRELARWIEGLVYPLHCFDFETWNPCVPPFDHVRPYVQIPFQYSVHIQAAPGAEPSHREFLAEAGGDPRPELIERMLEDLGRHGSIVVHHAAFERRRIEELAAYAPQHRSSLLALCDRFVDTELPFKHDWYLHPGLMGRSSIKVVLPTLVPGESYAGLAIAEGESASAAFEDLVLGRVPPERVAATRADLLAYCRQDTHAMVEIIERLRALSEGA